MGSDNTRGMEVFTGAVILVALLAHHSRTGRDLPKQAITEIGAARTKSRR
jgi:hypothetical protein